MTEINGKGLDTPPGKPIVLVDFDGVIHSYSSGWHGPTVIPDPPVSNAIEWLNDIIESNLFEIHIFSSRNFHEGGIEAMEDYLLDNGLKTDNFLKIKFPTVKSPAHIIIDDRAINFSGVFPTEEDVLNFKPWYKN